MVNGWAWLDVAIATSGCVSYRKGGSIYMKKRLRNRVVIVCFVMLLLFVGFFGYKKRVSNTAHSRVKIYTIKGDYGGCSYGMSEESYGYWMPSADSEKE